MRIRIRNTAFEDGPDPYSFETIRLLQGALHEMKKWNAHLGLGNFYVDVCVTFQ
jgi:hypothetical protein